MNTPLEYIPIQVISGILDEISKLNRLIRELQDAGENPDSLSIRQYKFLRDRFKKELQELLKEYDLIS
ncbi:MAG: hypothetical protein NW226_00015 [Microscillaceae bacterium]|nr:hypothetical protein [Microscillaceae bacterium]